MLETLLYGFPDDRRYFEGIGPLATNSVIAKGAMAASLYGNKIIYSGGAGSNSSYPTTSVLLTLGLDGLSSTATSIAGYDATWNSACTVGDKYWSTLGHTGTFNRTLRARQFSNGATILSASSSCPGEGRVRPIMVTLDNDTILYGQGYNHTNGLLTDMYHYKISSNTWVSKDPVPLSLRCKNSSGGTWCNEKGFIYLDFTERHECVMYDPVHQTFRKSSSFNKYLRTSYDEALVPTASCCIGKYLLIFLNQQTTANENKLACLRYDPDLDTWDMFLFNNISSRFFSAVTVSDDQSKIYIISGTNEINKSGDASVKIASMLILDATQFLRED